MTAGSQAELALAIGRGADLRVYTEFRFEEHIAPGGDGHPDHDGLIREVIDFRETIFVEGRHTGAVTTLRQPLEPPFGFNGTRPKMSYFLYQSDGRQACANVLLDHVEGAAEPGVRGELPTPPDMPKMHPEIVYDQGTSGPSRNFVYDMEVYRFFVRDDWQELLAIDADGHPVRGSIDAIEEAQIAGRELKIGIRGLAADLAGRGSGGVGAGRAAVGVATAGGTTAGEAAAESGADAAADHEVFSLLGSGFFHTKMRLYDALTHPLIRVAPAIPLEYRSFGWDLWRGCTSGTDGEATLRILDPYTRQFSDRPTRFAMRGELAR